MCRSERPIPEKERDKIALFCNVRADAVISAPNLKSIYDAPVTYHEEGLDGAVIAAFGMKDETSPDLSKWIEVADRIENAEGEVKIAVVGKYTGLEDAYKSIVEALTHGGIANKVKVNAEWIEAEIFEREDPIPWLDGSHAILIPGGFGERGSEGKIKAAGFARNRKIPFFGICLGMQMAVIEMARALIGVANAGSEEFDHERGNGTTEGRRFEPVVYHLDKWMKGDTLIERTPDCERGASMRLGEYPALLTKGSRVAGIYGSGQISERHRHRYEVALEYRSRLERHGVVFSGMSPDGALPEIVEISGHPWFIGVQFHPELKSSPLDPHPLFADFIRAAVQQSRLI